MTSEYFRRRLQLDKSRSRRVFSRWVSRNASSIERVLTDVLNERGLLESWIVALRFPVPVSAATGQHESRKRQECRSPERTRQDDKVSTGNPRTRGVIDWTRVCAFPRTAVLYACLGVTLQRACARQTPLVAVAHVASALHLAAMATLNACAGRTRDLASARVAGLIAFLEFAAVGVAVARGGVAAL